MNPTILGLEAQGFLIRFLQKSNLKSDVPNLETPGPESPIPVRSRHCRGESASACSPLGMLPCDKMEFWGLVGNGLWARGEQGFEVCEFGV